VVLGKKGMQLPEQAFQKITIGSTNPTLLRNRLAIIIDVIFAPQLVESFTLLQSFLFRAENKKFPIVLLAVFFTTTRTQYYSYIFAIEWILTCKVNYIEYCQQ